MTSREKKFYPSLDLCEACKWQADKYDTIVSKNLTHRNKISTKMEDIYGKTCLMCEADITDERILKREEYILNESENAKISWEKIFKSTLLYIIIVIVAVGFILWLRSWYEKPLSPFSDSSSKVREHIFSTELPILKQKYPNQNPELWHNVLKLTNYTKPIVQVLILLHKGNSKVAECFARDLVTSLINRIMNKNGVAIYKENSKVTEYGEELNHYLNLVSKHNHLIVLELDKMPGSTARMFHFLCDETPKSIRPSFFIFTVEDVTKETTEVTYPLKRAGDILRSAWSNLKENELHPLISRVVRNVAQISPENINC